MENHPETYKIALKNNIELLDASCPVVLKLQHKIKQGYETMQDIDGQIIIFGKEGHAEVQGLIGQTNDKAIVIASFEDLIKIDFSKPIYIYSQTTKSPKLYKEITDEISRRIPNHLKVIISFMIHYVVIWKRTAIKRVFQSK